MLQRLSLYPYVQLSVVLVFVAVVVFALMAFKRAEQDKVWVGLSKETAHQLGTPISSLMAWTEVLSETYPDSSLIPELGNDVKRLQLIAERFSKIGSAPELQPADIVAVIDNAVEYMSHRKSNHVEMIRYYEKDKIITVLNAALFEWVIENLAKNAMDAIQGHGKITFHVFEERGKVMVDVSDTGKGYTTKQRGWGLGLSLARRIVEDYHHGKIYVLYSEINKGTTFRIEMPLPGGGKGRA
jgi:signal transduction histidine kinase